ncbi:MAG: aminomethyl-transferring glycine dehydrogenase subunit GcvPA [Candidatus Aminicenantales bacterium]
MKYIPLSDEDKKEMLTRIGVSSTEELFRFIPKNLKLKSRLSLPAPLSETELERFFRELGEKNLYTEYLSFLGAGAYNHYIPAVVDYLSSRGEFVSPYTPYQPEVSQGTLQTIFEYQTLICQLTGMDISNASLYDGASATAEAVLMAHRLKNRSKVLVARTLHPEYRKVINTYTKNLGIQVEEVAYETSGQMDLQDVGNKLDEETTAIVTQSPNFIGIIENVGTIADIAHKVQALSIVVVAEPISLGILEPPGPLGADIVAGEGQSFGIPLSFGGPYLGFMACLEEFLRQFPGRIAGETRDAEGNRGFVLTLSTREQHIRRERATSNICTNQAWCALRAAIFLETMGKEGLRELALQNIQKAHYTMKRLTEIKGVRKTFSGTFFNEFVLEFSKDAAKVDRILREKRIIGGLTLEDSYPELRNCALFCVTEMHSREDIEKLTRVLEEALE